MDPTTAQEACFEAGIKFGALYHQFAGTPISPASCDSLERAITEAIENQPYCESVTVDIHEERLAEDLNGRPVAYTELTGRFMRVEIRVLYQGWTVVTVMTQEDGYPRMRIKRVEEPPPSEK